MARVVAAVAAHTTDSRWPPMPDDVCAAGAPLLSMAAVSVVLMSDGEGLAVWAPTGLGRRGEELQFGLGEGPCVDAYRAGTPVLQADFSPLSSARWPAFGPAAAEAGIRAAFAFPLVFGEARLGVLDLYHDQPGMLSDTQLADAAALADVAAAAVLDVSTGTPPGAVPWQVEPIIDDRAVVHQATGMVSAQLNVGVVDALARLRAHAFASGRPLRAVAKDVVARRLRLG